MRYSFPKDYLYLTELGGALMKIILKACVASITLAIGFLLGIFLLSGFVLWKTLVFAAACAVIGQLVYKLLRVIDEKFST